MGERVSKVEVQGPEVWRKTIDIAELVENCIPKQVLRARPIGLIRHSARWTPVHNFPPYWLTPTEARHMFPEGWNRIKGYNRAAQIFMVEKGIRWRCGAAHLDPKVADLWIEAARKII